MPRSTTAKKPKAKQRRPGRPLAITPEIEAELCELLRIGMYEQAACDVVGISSSTYYKWRAQGEELANLVQAAHEDGRAEPRMGATETRYLEFFRATTRARARKQHTYLSEIAKAAQGGAAFTEIRREIEVVRDPETDEVEQRLVREVQTRMVLRPDWRAAAWALERTDPAHFGRRDALELSGDALTPEQAINVGEAAVDDPVVGDAVDALLDRAVGHHEVTE